jgi:hypothetical protein
MKLIEFYVSLSGNDKWSGKISEPNETKTDGPFVTIDGARKNRQKELED